MKEQVIASRPARRGAPSKKGAQRPARRDGKEASRFSPRALVAYVPTAMKVAFGILAVIALAIGYRAASSASVFQVRAVEVVGNYNPIAKPAKVELKHDRISHWMKCGARPSLTVARLLKSNPAPAA